MIQMKARRQKFLQKTSHLQLEESDTDSICMICKEDKENSPICYLAYCSLSNIL